MITIVDYGMGNLDSIRNMFKRIGVGAEITGDPAQVAAARKILLPGVGAFGAAMQRIGDAGLREVLDHKALVERVPVLGICLGMQLLMQSSEEGGGDGLGWIRGAVHRFPADAGLKIPHMGWNRVFPVRGSTLTQDLGEEPRFYFVHSYYVRVQDEADAVLRTTYGVTFESAVAHGNIHGAQFHPEKSHRFGMRLLRNFAGL